MRRSGLGSFLALAVLFVSVACGQSASSTGSNTNWLERCDVDSDCGASSHCWCGGCTKPCSATTDCGSDGQCRATANVGCGEPSSAGDSVCVLTCESDADCAGEGSGLSCRNGACLPAAGTSGTGGMPSEVGGTAGMGGTGASDGGAAAMGQTGGTGASGAVEEKFPRGSYGVAGDHTCVIYGRQIFCRGSNLFGQLGNAPSMDVPDFRPVNGVLDAKSIAVGASHTCVVTEAGEVYCWGLNDRGQVGGPSAPEDTCPDYVLDFPGDYPCQPTPTLVPDVANAVAVAVSEGRSCAVLASGALKCWGELGELEGRVDDRNSVTSIELGTGGDCVLEGGGWDCSFDLTVSPPAITNDARVADGAGFWCLIEPNPYHSDMPDERKRVYCFGDNGVGQLGVGDRARHDTDGVSEVIIDVTDLALGDQHGCTLGVDKKVHCWGKNSSGQVGPTPLASLPCGYETCEPSPQVVVGLPPMQSIAAGGDRSCGFAEDGTLWCWGADGFGLGAPLRVAGPWEANASSCSDLTELEHSRREALLYADRTCMVDSDCVEVSLDMTCARTCATTVVARDSAAELADRLGALEEGSCPGIWAADCAYSEPTCAEVPTTRVICDAGYCTRDDPAHSGCTDHCACSAVRWASLSEWKDECAGLDLWAAIALGCSACEDSTVAVVITNRGDTRFEGDATISFEPYDTENPALELPDPVTVSLALDPGEVSSAISIPSRGAGDAQFRVTAPGDCNPSNDLNTTTLPSPTNACN